MRKDFIRLTPAAMAILHNRISFHSTVGEMQKLGMEGRRIICITSNFLGLYNE